MRAILWGLLSAVVGLTGCKTEMLGNPGGPAPVVPADASTARMDGAACWTSLLPPPVQPIQPTDTFDHACAAAAAAQAGDWSYPQTSAGTNADDRRYLVGRWASCDHASLGSLPVYPAIEFGANGRWRFLDLDPGSGAYVPVPRSDTTSGYYYLLGTGQLDLTEELPGTGGAALHVTFAQGMEAANFNPVPGQPNVFVRLTPSPLDGADNPPPTAAGDCSMVGDWDVPSGSGSAPAVFSFDAAGNFVVNASAANRCSTPGGYGTYALSPGVFQLTTNVGLGLCSWWFSASYQATFDASCQHLSLVRQYDNCTGGRSYFNEPTTLTRR